MRIVNSKNDRAFEDLHVKSDVEFGVFFVYKKNKIAEFGFGRMESFPGIEEARAACIDYLGKRSDLGDLRVSFISRKYLKSTTGRKVWRDPKTCIFYGYIRESDRWKRSIEFGSDKAARDKADEWKKEGEVGYVLLPSLRGDLKVWEKYIGKSVDVLVRFDGSDNIRIGRYLYGVGEWDVDGRGGSVPPAVSEWWDMPVPGTGKKIGRAK